MWFRKSSYAGAGPSKISTAPTCMWLFARSCARNEASVAESRSPCACAIRRKRIRSGDHAAEARHRREDQHAGEHRLVAAGGGEAGEEAPADEVGRRDG